MKQHQVVLQAHFNPETLERALRVARHRDFQICVTDMEAVLDAQNINIELTVASPRPVELLFSQLSKLVDIVCVETQQSTSQQTRA